MADNREPARFTDNFVRLLGLHGLTQNFTAQLLGVSEATMSSWIDGKSTPSLAKAIDIADLFQISTDRFIVAEFSDLLAHERAGADWYDRVEKRISAGARSSSPCDRPRLEPQLGGVGRRAGR